MMSQIDPHLREQVLQRDKCRCRECGIQVILEKGLMSNIHHIQPRSAGGLDVLENLITLCEPCHVTKLGHTFMLSDRSPDSYPGFIKWMIREIAINLLFQAEYLNPRDFPARQVAADLQKAVEALQSVFPLFDHCPPGGTEIDWTKKKSTEAELNDVIEGLKISYGSHEYQRGLDEILQRFWQERS